MNPLECEWWLRVPWLCGGPSCRVLQWPAVASLRSLQVTQAPWDPADGTACAHGVDRALGPTQARMPGGSSLGAEGGGAKGPHAHPRRSQVRALSPQDAGFPVVNSTLQLPRGSNAWKQPHTPWELGSHWGGQRGLQQVAPETVGPMAAPRSAPSNPEREI